MEAQFNSSEYQASSRESDTFENEQQNVIKFPETAEEEQQRINKWLREYYQQGDHEQ